ncbi:MAG: hypothetical protein JKY67_22475 [Pseudomonadales bacterium]|nr:hypothetical protein [Pseudomonadales bacterium]
MISSFLVLMRLSKVTIYVAMIGGISLQRVLDNQHLLLPRLSIQLFIQLSIQLSFRLTDSGRLSSALAKAKRFIAIILEVVTRMWVNSGG